MSKDINTATEGAGNGISVADSLPELPISNIPAVETTEYFSSPIFASSTMIFLISILVFILMSNLIKNNKEPEEILKTFGIPLIVVASVFVVVTGLDVNKLTPVIGLLGTIAGYLLGRAERQDKKTD